MVSPKQGPMSVNDMAKTPEQIAQAGFSVVLPGALYHRLCEYVQELVRQARSPEEYASLAELQNALIAEATPVKAKFR